MAKTHPPIRLPESGESGIPFSEHLEAVAGPHAATISAFLQQWDTSRDRLGRAPSDEEYAHDWPARPGSVGPADELLAFRTVFPNEEDPSRILDVLWQGTAHDRNRTVLPELLSVLVVPA